MSGPCCRASRKNSQRQKALWRDRSQLTAIRDALYANDISETATGRRDESIESIRSWTTHTDCPIHIEMTALLFAARQQYAPSSNPTNPIITHLLYHNHPHHATVSHLALMAALNRFVAVFCDTSAHLIIRTSMNDTAFGLGIPNSIVNCRHEATHEGLPGVNRLLEESALALKWLWKVYWSRLSASDTPPGDLRARVVECLAKYRSDRRDEFSHNTQLQADLTAVLALTRLQRRCRAEFLKKEIARALVQQEKMLVPAGFQRGGLDGAVLQFWLPLLARLAKVLKGFTALLTEEVKRDCMGSIGDEVLMGCAGENENKDEIASNDGEGDAMDVDKDEEMLLRTTEPRQEALGTWALWLCSQGCLWESSEEQVMFWKSIRWELSSNLVMSEELWASWQACERDMVYE